MRIIGGKYKGRKFNPPLKKWRTRPTMDFTREALFNVLANDWDFNDISVLDLFGGTGSVSLEFVSRGVVDLVYVDKFHACVTFLKKVKSDLGINDEVLAIQSDAIKYIKRCNRTFDIIFCDPPYDYPSYQQLLELILNKKLLNDNGLLIMEHDQRTNFQASSAFSYSRKYGSSYFSFFYLKD